MRKTLSDKGVAALKPRASRYAYPDPELRRALRPRHPGRRQVVRRRHPRPGRQASLDHTRPNRSHDDRNGAGTGARGPHPGSRRVAGG